jgi:membrane protease YdiL (CAAX protease family)
MEQHKDFPNFWTAVLILTLLIGLQIIISIMAFDFGYAYERGDPRATGVIIVLSCGIIFSILMSYKRINYRKLFNPGSYSVKSILIIFTIPLLLIMGGGVFWVTDITNLLILYFPLSDNESMMFYRLVNGGVVSIITVCIIGPLIEEMLFRGIILRSFLVNYSTSKSIVLSALLFALYHLSIYQIPVAFLLGCLFAWLYVRTSSLYPSILGHVIYNSFAMIFWSFQDMSDVNKVEVVGYFNSPGVDVAAVIATVIGLLALTLLLRPQLKVDG